MARDEIDILGVKLDESSGGGSDTSSEDSSEDSSGDRQERSESLKLEDGQSTLDATIVGNDPRGDLERATLERETIFDANANMPEGMRVDTVLAGMTDLGGNSIKMGPNRHGVGQDSILGEHGLDANSPLNVSRNPLDAIGGGGAQPTWVGEGHKDPPPGFGGKYDDVSAPKTDPVTKFAIDAAAGAGKIAREVVEIAKADLALPGVMVDRFIQEFTKPDETPPPPPPEKMDDGSGDGGMRLPTAQEVEAALNSKGGGTVSRPVEGGGPQVHAGTTPPANPRYRGVTDPIDEAGTQTGVPDGTTLAGGAPNAPVIHTLNPDAGVNKPRQTSNSGSGQGDINPIVNSGGQAATAEYAAPDTNTPAITEVGADNKPSSIQSIDTGADDVDSLATSLGIDAPAERGIIIPDVGREGERGIIIPDIDREGESGIIIPDFGRDGDSTATSVSFDEPELEGMSMDFADRGTGLLDEPDARGPLDNDSPLDG